MAGQKSFSIYALLKGKDESAPLLKGLGKIRAGAKGISGVLSGLKGGLGSMLGPLGLGGVLGVASLGGAVAAVRNLTMGYAESQDELGAFARQHRMAVAEVQRWQFVAKMSEVSTDSLRGSMGGLTQTLGQVHAGAGRAFKFLSTQKNLSPLLKSLKGARSTSDALGISLNFLGRVKDQGQRALLAKKLGLDPEMLRIVDQGAAGIARLLKEADRYGTTSEKSAREVEEFNQAHKRLDASLEGLKLSIGEKLVPVLTPYIGQLTNWVAGNRNLIGQKVGEWAAGAADGFGKLVERGPEIAQTIRDIGFAISPVVKALVTMGNAIKGITGAHHQEADQKFKDSLGVTDAEWGHAVKTVSDRQKGSSDPLIRGTEEFRQAVADEINRRITEQRAIGKPVKNEPLSSILRQQSVSGTVRFEVSAAPGTGVSVDGDTSGPIDFVIAGDVGKPSHATGGGL